MAQARPGMTMGQIDVRKLIFAFFKNSAFIAIAAALGFTGVAAYLGAIYPDQYTASTTMYVYVNNPNQTNYQYATQSDLNTATRLMETYMVVIRSDKVMEAVVDRLGPGYTAQYVSQAVSIGSVADTEVMRVAATTPSAQLSMDICNAIADCAPTEIIRVVGAGSVEVIDYAKLPPYPDSKNLFAKSLIGGVAAAALVMGAVTLIVMKDVRIETQADLTCHYTPPLLATFPDLSRKTFSLYGKYGRFGKYAFAQDKALTKLPARRGDPRFVITEKTSPAIVEIYKLLRTNLGFAMEGQKNSAVIVTSSIPAEGKSTVSANLAIVAAQDNRRVLLIDADMRKPKQALQFIIPPQNAGLSTYLTGYDRLDDVLHKEVRPGLDVLPAGRVPSNPSELLGSQAMRELLDLVKARYDLVVVDSPPVNVVTDSLVLSHSVAGAIMVVRHHVSNHKELQMALGTMAFANLKVLGFVLTDMGRRGSGAYYKRYRYYQRYNTGYYSAHQE